MKFKIDIGNLENEIKNLSSWDDWYTIKKEIFRVDRWPKINSGILEKEGERHPESIDGYQWNPTITSYDISQDLFHLYEKTRWRVFAKLEPEADEENRSHPEWHGKWCVYCKIWTREYTKDWCPKCGNELLSLPLND